MSKIKWILHYPVSFIADSSNPVARFNDFDQTLHRGLGPKKYPLNRSNSHKQALFDSNIEQTSNRLKHKSNSFFSSLSRILIFFLLIPLVFAADRYPNNYQYEKRANYRYTQNHHSNIPSSISDAGRHFAYTSSYSHHNPETTNHHSPTTTSLQPSFSNQAKSSYNPNRSRFSNNIFNNPHSPKNHDNNINDQHVYDSAVTQNALAEVSSADGGLRSAISSFMRPRHIDDWQVSDFILVCSIDGSLHARDRQTGLEVWSIPGERPLVQVSTTDSCSASNNCSTTEHINCLTNDCEDKNLIWIVEPLGDGILYYFTPQTGLQKLPISIKDLVMQSPFALHGDDKIYTGTRKTTLFSIDSTSGKVLKVYGSGKDDLGNARCKVRENDPLQLMRKNGGTLLDFEDEEDDYDYKSQDKGSFLIGRTGMLTWLKF